MRYFRVSLLLLIISCSPSRHAGDIIDRPVKFDEERKELTLEYLQDRYGIAKEQPVIQPKMIVVHWTAIPTLEASFAAFDPVRLPGSRSDIQGAGALNVSAHFLVDRDGRIYRLMPEIWMARHVIGLNHSAIGIENVGGTPVTPLTKAQLMSNLFLVSYLATKYSIDYVIGHHEYTLFEGHPLWLEKNEAYRTTKVDPGKEFMNDLRKGFTKYNFKPLPVKN
ncbi:N-acetylmuramoyl-L-alanine amidase [Antarcticibacterium flavum]|uniref:N-acetylmuramoyl-L-alanine amidase n=1 Tax=Antarcticibacterium flavum TaxID=2058175 RepID=A0A5B7X1J9_9FLAO|nr:MULTISPECIES: peptidoglycan recognition family protein [Antarcticibacterium]MCM4160389.1 N-acetylmuramoyl-L-alanine amidase [Antarcticibacterium sp. W02-3]QCY69140.1 N-acetylmuramoyl-L-alanine amidase [Antarcticibacterium flavum]